MSPLNTIRASPTSHTHRRRRPLPPPRSDLERRPLRVQSATGSWRQAPQVQGAASCHRASATCQCLRLHATLVGANPPVRGSRTGADEVHIRPCGTRTGSIRSALPRCSTSTWSTSATSTTRCGTPTTLSAARSSPGSRRRRGTGPARSRVRGGARAAHRRRRCGLRTYRHRFRGASRGRSRDRCGPRGASCRARRSRTARRVTRRC